MKLAIITPGSLPLPAIRGGAVESLVDTLIEYNENKNIFELKILSCYDEKAKKKSEIYNNSEFIYINTRKFIFNLAQKRLIPMRWYYRIYCYLSINKLKKLDVNVIIIQNEFIYADIIRKKIKDVPLVLHLHNDYINVSNCPKNTIKNLKQIITVSDYIKNRVRDVDKKIPIKTVYNGIDLNNFVPNKLKRKEVRKQYNFKEDDIVVIYAGRIIEEKGVLELVSAITKIKNDKVKLLICGGSSFEGSKETSYVKKVKDKARGFEDKIIFTGFINYNELPGFYQCADIGCVPSIWEESFGLVVVEQMACGLPVVVSDSGAIPEIVDENSAIIVKRGKEFISNLKYAIEEMACNQHLRENMGREAFNIAQNFSKEKYSYKFFNTINNIVKESYLDVINENE